MNISPINANLLNKFQNYTKSQTNAVLLNRNTVDTVSFTSRISKCHTHEQCQRVVGELSKMGVKAVTYCLDNSTTPLEYHGDNNHYAVAILKDYAPNSSDLDKLSMSEDEIFESVVKIYGKLDTTNSNLTSLGSLKSVEKSVNIQGNVSDLGNLTDINIISDEGTTIPKVIINSDKITSLGKLENIFCPDGEIDIDCPNLKDTESLRYILGKTKIHSNALEKFGSQKLNIGGEFSIDAPLLRTFDCYNSSANILIRNDDSEQLLINTSGILKLDISSDLLEVLHVNGRLKTIFSLNCDTPSLEQVVGIGSVVHNITGQARLNDVFKDVKPLRPYSKIDVHTSTKANLETEQNCNRILFGVLNNYYKLLETAIEKSDTKSPKYNAKAVQTIKKLKEIMPNWLYKTETDIDRTIIDNLYAFINSKLQEGDDRYKAFFDPIHSRYQEIVGKMSC